MPVIVPGPGDTAVDSEITVFPSDEVLELVATVTPPFVASAFESDTAVPPIEASDFESAMAIPPFAAFASAFAIAVPPPDA